MILWQLSFQSILGVPNSCLKIIFALYIIILYMQLQFILFSTAVVFCLYLIDDTHKTFNVPFQLHIVSRRKKKSERRIDWFLNFISNLLCIQRFVWSKIIAFGFHVGLSIYSKNHRFRRVWMIDLPCQWLGIVVLCFDARNKIELSVQPPEPLCATAVKLGRCSIATCCCLLGFKWLHLLTST